MFFTPGYGAAWRKRRFHCKIGIAPPIAIQFGASLPPPIGRGLWVRSRECNNMLILCAYFGQAGGVAGAAVYDVCDTLFRCTTTSTLSIA